MADGARDEAEREACERTRAIVDRVDWPCEVLRNFSDVNLGCRRRPVSGIDWAFGQVEEAIILEDDCLPTRPSSGTATTCSRATATHPTSG